MGTQAMEDGPRHLSHSCPYAWSLHTKVMIFWEGAHIQEERRGLNAYKEAHRCRDTQIVFQIQLNIVVIKVKMQRN